MSYKAITVERIEAATDKAFLLVVDGEEEWCPRSCILDDEEYSKDDGDVEMHIKTWWLRKVGWD